jgi:hypothetical protein
MDDACADAQVALGAVLFGATGTGRAPSGASAGPPAVPNHTEAYLQYGSLLEALGRLEEGLEMKLRALERDPFSPLVHLQISMSHFFQRRYDDTIDWAKRALDIDPRHPHAREFLAGAYLKTGDLDRYMEANLEHARMHGAPAELLDTLKQAYSSGGPTGLVRFASGRPPGNREPSRTSDGHLPGRDGDLGRRSDTSTARSSRDPALVHLAVGRSGTPATPTPQFEPPRAGGLEPVPLDVFVPCTARPRSWDQSSWCQVAVRL